MIRLAAILDDHQRSDKPSASRGWRCGNGGRDQLRVRAYENGVYIAMANWAGPRFKGHSMTIEADGTLMELGGKDEQILQAVFDMANLRKLRRRGIYGLHHRQPIAYGPLLLKQPE